MPFLDRPTHKLNYDISGDGPPVLLTHSFSASKTMWQGQVDALSSQFKLLTWDLHGHGSTESSSDPSDYSEQSTVQDMAALLDACDIDQAVVGGLSLGGYMSLAFYRAFPDRVRALMLFDTGPGFKKDEPRDKWNANAQRTADIIDNKGLEPLERNSQEVRIANHASPTALAHAARGMLTQADGRVISSLADIKVPTLVLVGAEDKPFFAATDYMASKIPNASKVVIEGAGHAANLDQPDAFNDAVKSFLLSL